MALPADLRVVEIGGVLPAIFVTGPGSAFPARNAGRILNMLFPDSNGLYGGAALYAKPWLLVSAGKRRWPVRAVWTALNCYSTLTRRASILGIGRRSCRGGGLAMFVLTSIEARP